MKESIRQERIEKLKSVTRAGIEHLERGLATLEDANLYTSEEQEKKLDSCIADLERLIAKLKGHRPVD